MAGSVFSTAENFQKVQDALTTVEQAITEAEMAVSAGVPGAADLLKKAQDARDRILTFKNVYFPNGTAPTT